MNKNQNKVTVVIPTYNEAKTVRRIALEAQKYCDDILIVCAKKSTDKTLDIVKSMGLSYVVDNGIGKGDALRLAIKTVKEGIIVFMDADGSHDPKDIPRLVAPIKKDKADLVIGSRITGGSDEFTGTVDNYFRLVFNNTITLIINLRFKQHISDYENGFRAIKVKVAKKLELKEDIITIEQEMGMKFLKKGYRMAEVPTHEHNGGKSSYGIWRVGPRFIYQLIRDIF